MGLNFTKSQDGKPRVDLRVTIRLDAEEIASIKKFARKAGEPWRIWLRRRAEDGIYSAMVRADDAEG